MKLSDWLIVLSTLIAPLLAIQAQKFLERYRDDQSRRLAVFKTLMATRAAAASPQHVNALNSIDLEFQGKQYAPIRTCWKTYLDHLSSYPKDDEKRQVIWEDRRIDLLAKLLMEMGKPFGYEFDEVHVKKGIYAPEAHSRLENEQLLVRRGVLALLYGNTALKMAVQSFPVSNEALHEQGQIRHALIEMLNGKRSLKVANEDGSRPST